ncbi:MAG: thioesterase family protein [Chloroflexota bacterium]
MNIEEYLQVGNTSQATFKVEEQHTAPHVGSGSVRVLATPWMISFMEITARKMLDEQLPEGYASVGTMVHVHHRAPSKLGSTVRAQVEIQSIERSKVLFIVAVLESDNVIGEGTHERFVIEVARFMRRVEE